jgi:hypothetical protein
MAHSLLHAAQGNFIVHIRPLFSPKLTSGGIVDPSNAAALLHVSHMDPKKGFHCASGRL